MRQSIAHPYIPQNVTEDGYFTYGDNGLVFKNGNGDIVNNYNTYSLVSCSQCVGTNYGLATNINPKLKDSKGLTPLHYISFHERCEEPKNKPNLAKVLLDNGADINALYIIEAETFFYDPNSENRHLLASPLYIALTNQPLVAKLLLERGADINQLAFYFKDGHYKPINPLEYAIKIGSKELVNHCLQNYFNIYEPFREGVTALSYAQEQYTQDLRKGITYFDNSDHLRARKEIFDTIKMASESRYYSLRFALNKCKFYVLEHTNAALTTVATAGLAFYRGCASISINAADVLSKILGFGNEATRQL